MVNDFQIGGGGLKISSLLLTDDVLLLASSSWDLQQALGQFSAECEAAGMRVSNLKPEKREGSESLCVLKFCS